MDTIWIGYPKCSTCKKAKCALTSKKIPFTERNIVEQNPTYEELKSWTTRYQIPVDSLFNTSGILYREMGLKEKRKEMTDDEKLALLSTNGMLVKRPILLLPTQIVIGFQEERYMSL